MGDGGAFARLNYYRRIFSAYILRRRSHLTFWHESPEITGGFPLDTVGEYYMTFAGKAGFQGPFDDSGVPLLDYHGAIGRQYNPIAIAQYGLAMYNRFMDTGGEGDRQAFLRQANWLVDNLQENAHGVPVWNHNFDWEYVQTLTAPWYSGLAQGQGISVLVRAHELTGEPRYMDSAEQAFIALKTDVEDGGVIAVDGLGDRWIEEYVVQPPSHILNGFIWALWGVRDLHVAYGNHDAGDLWNAGVHTLLSNLARYDVGYWSLYDLTRPGGARMIASPFYHRLHIAQLRGMAALSGAHEFGVYADRWASYQSRRLNRHRSLLEKARFKLLNY